MKSEIYQKGNRIEKRKVVVGFHNPIGAFRRKAVYIYEIRIFDHGRL